MLRSKLFATVAVSLAAVGLATAPAVAQYPEKPIRIIVPTDAGGAIDGIARIFQRAFEEHDLLGAPVVVVNMPGAGGAVGTRAVKDAEADGYTIGLWHNGLVTSAATGVTDYDHTAFDLIGSTGFVELGLGARADSDVADFDTMIAKAKDEPESVKVAVNIGLPVHFIPLMVAEKAGAEMRMVQVGGGAKRLASVLGGNTDTALFSIQELVKYQPSGLAPVVVFSTERVDQLPDVPTAQESGVDVVATDSRIWLAPKGTPEDRLATLQAAFQEAMQLPAVREQLEGFGINPDFVERDELLAELNRVRGEVEPLVEKAKTAAAD